MAASSEADVAAKLIERLLSDPAFRARFRRDPAGACREAGLDELAQEMSVAGGKAMMTLDIRESKSSLAGVMMAAAMEGAAIYQFTENLLPHLDEIPGQIARRALARGPAGDPGRAGKKPPSGGGAAPAAAAVPAEAPADETALPTAPPPAAPPPPPEADAKAAEKAAAAQGRRGEGRSAAAAGGGAAGQGRGRGGGGGGEDRRGGLAGGDVQGGAGGGGGRARRAHHGPARIV